MTKHAISALCLSMLLGLGAGCESSTHRASMVDRLPDPSFTGPLGADGPGLAPPQAPKPPDEIATRIVEAPPVAPPPAPAPSVAAGVPPEWVPTVAANRWKWIVIHHSATPVGGAARFGREHKAKGWDELGYHFVIGNGTDTKIGQVEVGTRWPKQKWGAHAKTPDEQYNNFGIGICLVGNFDLGRPSEVQMKSLSRLVAYLMRTYNIPADHIIGHGDTKKTDCPGRYLNVATVRQMSNRILAETGQSAPLPTRTAAATPSRDLLYDPKR